MFVYPLKLGRGAGTPGMKRPGAGAPGNFGPLLKTASIFKSMFGMTGSFSICTALC